MMQAWIVGAVAAVVGILVGYWLRGSTAKAELTAAKTELAQVKAESAIRAGFEALAAERAANIAQLTADCAQLRSELNTRTDIETAKKLLSSEFKALSADNIKDANDQLAKAAEAIVAKHQEITVADVKLHRQHIETILKPVEETIKRLDKHVEESDLARTRAEALLDEQIKRLAGASESLTHALTKPVVRGSWGEMTLENALENAGLDPEIDFLLQHYTDAEDGQKRTDAIVNLPKGRKLIIDSKNLMESYLALTNAQDDAQKAVLAEAHSKSLRRHIKALSAKEYWRRYEGLDCVILFIPHDGMYHAAIQDESELIRDASEKRVFVSNPMTLIPLLKAVRFVLDQERLNKNAEEIKEIGADLYVELTRFAGNMSTIGEKLHDAVRAYNGAIPGLDRYILAKSRRLKQLGSSKGPEPALPEEVDLEPRPFASKELRALNFPAEVDTDDGTSVASTLAAQAEENGKSDA
jgi:DNA recombination protein RmuC